MKKTYEILFRKKDGSIQRTEWIHRSLFEPMQKVIEQAIKRGEEIEMVIHSITRIY